MHGGAFSGFKVALFVKDVVTGEQRLSANGLDHTRFAPGGGVIKGATMQVGATVLHEADDGWHLADFLGDGVERVFGVAHEASFKKKITRRIATDRQLRKEHKLGTVGDECIVGIQDARGVAREITDRGIDLCDADFHKKVFWKRLFDLCLANPGLAGIVRASCLEAS